MHLFHANGSWLGVLGAGLLVTACGGSTRHADSPHGETTTTAASMEGGLHVQKLLVAEPNHVAMVAREGCVSTMRTSGAEVGDDELRVRCPKAERLASWMHAADALVSKLTLTPAPDPTDDDEHVSSEHRAPTAKVLLTSGKVMQVTKPAEVARLANELHALEGELASAEEPAPGPATPSGWQMLHVSGPAHVSFAGTPAHGMLEARMSTSGQYLCEFVTGGSAGAMRATKSGWLPQTNAAHAIDEVLAPFNATESDAAKPSYAAGIQNGKEKMGNVPSTMAVFERFAGLQEALGDACLPELEGPSPQAIGL